MSESAQDLYDEGNGMIAIGNIDSAAEKYKRSIEIDPKFFDGWHALGMALMKSGKLKEAIGAGLMATDLRPNDQLAWTSLSQMYMKNGQIKEAEAAKSNATVIGIGGKLK
ncbi:MAG: tetratricopeptide repeat protein [Verrucomicrobiota bacterium]|jgi:predicted Zn-dependent protease|nr:tetratricopeptide repeat protein [Verrucomicrobiota bacterium]